MVCCVFCLSGCLYVHVGPMSLCLCARLWVVWKHAEKTYRVKTTWVCFCSMTSVRFVWFLFDLYFTLPLSIWSTKYASSCALYRARCNNNTSVWRCTNFSSSFLSFPLFLFFVFVSNLFSFPPSKFGQGERRLILSYRWCPGGSLPDFSRPKKCCYAKPSHIKPCRCYNVQHCWRSLIKIYSG